jgi:DNA repair exonuclease SbcCD ATPase subunit
MRKLQEPLTAPRPVSKLAVMNINEAEEEVDRLRAQVVSMDERIAHQTGASQRAAFLLQAARDEREEALTELKRAKDMASDLRMTLAERDRLTAVAVAEFGRDLGVYRELISAKEEEIERLRRLRQTDYDARCDLAGEVERLRAEVRRLGDFPAEGGPYRTGVVEEVRACNDRLNRENEALAHKVVDANEARDRAQNETARLTERWTKLGTRLAGMRRATNALAREVGVLRHKIAQDDNFHGLWLGGVDRAIAEALAASQEAEGT